MDKFATAFPKLAVMLVISLILALISSLGVFNDLQSAGLDMNLTLSQPFVGAVKRLDDAWHLITNLQQIQVENLSLKNQIAQLNQQLSDMGQLQSQNQYLLSQLNLQLPVGAAHLVAPVARYEYMPAPGYIYVRVGLRSGTAVGDMATRYNYIVGQVTELLGDYAKVRLISANDTNIPVRVGDKGVVGQLVGQAGLDFKVINIDQTAEVSVGDSITIVDPSGEDLRGFTIGTVAKITGQEADASKVLEIDTPIDLNHLDFVVIIPSHV